MDASLPGDQLVLVAGALLAFGVLSLGLAQRLRAPSLLVFLAIGMALGSDGLGWIEIGFEDLRTIQVAGTAALVLILYEGGLATPRSAFERVAAPALVLATVGVALTAGVVALFTWSVLGLEGSTALLIGAVVASTDAAAVFAAMRGAPLPERVRQLLQVESGFNDPMAVLLTVGAIEVWRGAPAAGDWLAFGALQLGGGAIVGLGLGLGGARILGRVRLANASAYPVFALAVAGLAYGTATTAGASGFLAVYVAGLVVGNRVPRHRRLIRSFHDGLSSVAEIGLFLLLGLLVFPSQVLDLSGRGLLIALVLVFVARPLAVWLVLPWFSIPAREAWIVAWAGLRGAVPIVLATFPLSAGHPDGPLIFDVVFFVVVVSAAVQGATVAPLARRLGLQPAASPWDAMVEVVPLDGVAGEMVEVELDATSSVVGRTLADAPLPKGARVAAVLRDHRVVVPTGVTALLAGDRLLVIAEEGQVEDLARWSGSPDEPSGGRRANPDV
jgi:cell volume regulation protein A